jgi:RNA-directed DNA polymerase
MEALGLNDDAEAYPGKLTGRKQGSHPAQAIQPRDGANTQAGTQSPLMEPNTSQPATGEGRFGLPGSQRVARVSGAVRNLGDPAASRRSNYENQAGKATQRQGAWPEEPQGVRLAHSSGETTRPVEAGLGEGANRESQPAQETSAAREAEFHWRTSLRAIAKKAREQKRYRFGGLYRLINEQSLRACFFQLRRNAASGVDEVTWQEYHQNLEENLAQLVQRLKNKSYHARLIRRKYIPKGEGQFRPLGITVLEDKLVQWVVTHLLTAIYEADFLPCNRGYRPGSSARQASCDLAATLTKGRYEFVVEADIKGYFEHIQWPELRLMLRRRIDDGALLGLIVKWLKAGVLEEDGTVIHPEAGTPQGGIVSPVLANVYPHYVLDQWFEQQVRPANRGPMYLIRYADDFVCAFGWRHEAERFLKQLEARLAEFGLELAPDKTRLLRFGRKGGAYNGRFDFLGFEFYWKLSRQGKPLVQRRTARKRLRRSVAHFTRWIRARRHRKLKEVMKQLASKYRGTWNYYGVQGNFKSLEQFYQQTRQIFFKWLNRRSQRRNYTARAFDRLLKRFQIPKPHIVEGTFPAIEQKPSDWSAALDEIFRHFNQASASA